MAKSRPDSRDSIAATADQAAAPSSAPASLPKLYDADDENPTFARFYADAEQLLLTAKGLEPLVNWLESPERVAIVDFGARGSRALTDFEDNTGFLQMAERYNTRVVVCFALAPVADSIGLLRELAEKLQGNVAWVVARSTFAVGTWDLWEQSETRKRLAELNASEMLAPTLDADAWTGLDRYSLPAAVAVEDKRLTLVERSYIWRWRQKYATEFDATIPPLVNPNGKTVFIVTGGKGGVGKSSFARALTDWFHTPQAAR